MESPLSGIADWFTPWPRLRRATGCWGMAVEGRGRAGIGRRGLAHCGLFAFRWIGHTYPSSL